MLETVELVREKEGTTLAEMPPPCDDAVHLSIVDESMAVPLPMEKREMPPPSESALQPVTVEREIVTDVVKLRKSPPP